MTTTAERVREETSRFRAALGGLMAEHQGKWVVFKGGEIVAEFDTEDEAYFAGMERFGRHGGHVVAQVVEQPPPRISAVSAFLRRR